jgi:hypothetical protein
MLYVEVRTLRTVPPNPETRIVGENHEKNYEI